MERLILISNIITGSIRTIICLFLIFRLLSTEKPKKTSITAALSGILIISIILSALSLSDFYRMILETLWIAVCACRFQSADARMSLFIGIFYEIAMSFWQFLIAECVVILFHSPNFMNFHTCRGQISVWLLHVSVIAVAFYLHKRPKMEGKKAFRFASLIVVMGFVAVITLSQQTILLIPDDTLDMWTILAVVLMMSVLVFNMNRQYEVEKELARLKTEQAELLERDYTTINRAYEINAKLFHDFHNHIGILHQFLSHEKTEEAMQYLDELQSPVKEMTDTVWTGDETVDYLINSKAVKAQASDIQYQIHVEFPRHTNLRNIDLCAILGNLLDNALEAAQQVPEKDRRFVRLTIRRINQMLIIKVENSFSTLPLQENGALKTSKAEKGLHGWGLKSVQTAAEKYDGILQTSYADNTFRAVATLSYQGAATVQTDHKL